MLKPMFSVVMPCFLGEYRGAAAGRREKFLRAVDSVVQQTYQDWELVIVADGCELTEQLYTEHYAGIENIACYRIRKEPLWSTRVRNAGISKATGRFIAYLDADDTFGSHHLEKLAAKLETDLFDWFYYNALFYDTRHKRFVERTVDINRCAEQGTCNIVHRNNGILWPEPPKNRTTGTIDYGRQDCSFIDLLKKRGEGLRIATAEYMVCHIPGKYDV